MGKLTFGVRIYNIYISKFKRSVSPQTQNDMGPRVVRHPGSGQPFLRPDRVWAAEETSIIRASLLCAHDL